MTEGDFQAYLEEAIRDYAQEHVKAGNWTDAEALNKSRQEFATLLPEGTASKNQFLFSIQTPQGTNVGMLWFAIRDKSGTPFAFIYDFRIESQFQRRGFATQALRALDERVKALGLNEIELHVFGHNHAARALYEKSGYETTNILMSKKLS